MLSGIAALFCRIAWPRRGGKCPQCGETVIPPAPLAERPWETVIRCRCGWAGSFSHLVEKEKGPPRQTGSAGDAVTTGFAAPPPPGSGIVHQGGVEETWSLPRSGRSGGLFAFGLIWLTISVPGAILMWMGRMGTNADGMSLLFRAVFGILFPGIGAMMLYAGLRMKYARHWLSLDGEFLTLERELFGRRKRRTLRRASITRVELREFYSRNYQPVYGLEIRGADGKLRFGTGLTDEEKAWLEQDVRRALGLLGECVSGGTEVSAAPAVDGVHSPALEIERTGRAVTLRLTPGKSTLAKIGLSVMLFSAFFLGMAWFVIFRDTWGDGAIAVFSVILRIPFVVFPLLIMALGWLAWREGRRRANTVVVLHVNDSGLTLEKIHRGRSSLQEWRRAEVARVQTAPAGSINGQRVLHGEIVTTDRVVWFGAGSESGDLETMCAVARQTLGLNVAHDRTTNDYPHT